MLLDVMAHCGLTKDFRHAGFFETEQHKRIFRQLKTVALFVDEAHDLHHPTLTGLKRLMEVVQEGGGKLSITVEILETTLSKRMDDLIKPTLIRHGYNERALVEQFPIKLSEVRQFMKGDLDSARTFELTEEMREAGLPI